MSGTVLTVVLGVCAPERTAVMRLLGEHVSAASIAENDDDVPNAVAAAAAALQADARRMVVAFPTGTVAHDVLALGHPHGGCLPVDTAFGAIVTVVDAVHLLDDLQDDDDLPIGWNGVPTERPRGVVAVDQIEHAHTLLVVNAETCGRDRLDMVLTLLCHLNPRARLTVVQEGGPWGAGVVASVNSGALQVPGWVDVLNGEHDPFLTGHGISAVRYQNLRPFHPGRLHELMEADLEHRHGQLIRSAGFCRFATRPGMTAHWDQVGPAISFEFVGRDSAHPSAEPLALGQELVLIGRDLDPAGLTAALDECVLTDGELADGPLVWLTYPDPFPEWTRTTPLQHRR